MLDYSISCLLQPEKTKMEFYCINFICEHVKKGDGFSGSICIK